MPIRTAQPHEAAALEALQRRSSDVWPAYREQLAAHPDAIERLPAAELVAGRVRVAHDDGDLGALGFCAVLAPGPDGLVELDGLFVEPGLLRRGIGRSLVEDAAARAVGPLTVIAGPEGEGFYARCGFVRVADATTRFGPAARWTRWTSGY